VDGLISARVRLAFPDMEIYEVPPYTIIKRDVVDDADLHGVLALIQSLGLRLISVNLVP
jgi:hypothetical protein